jgi:transposase
LPIDRACSALRIDRSLYVADDANDLTPGMRRIFTLIFDDLRQLERRIVDVNRKIKAIAAPSDTAPWLMTIPGIGPLTRFWPVPRRPDGWLG